MARRGGDARGVSRPILSLRKAEKQHSGRNKICERRHVQSEPEPADGKQSHGTPGRDALSFAQTTLRKKPNCYAPNRVDARQRLSLHTFCVASSRRIKRMRYDRSRPYIPQALNILRGCARPCRFEHLAQAVPSSNSGTDKIQKLRTESLIALAALFFCIFLCLLRVLLPQCQRNCMSLSCLEN